MACPLLQTKPPLFLKEAHRKTHGSQTQGGLLKQEGLNHGKLELEGTLEIMYEISFSTEGNWDPAAWERAQN